MRIAPKVDQNSPINSERSDLWAAFARSVRVNVLAEFGVQAVRVAGLVLLARVLMPADFGILRILIAISFLTTLLGSAGIPDALIQRAELMPTHESTAWWLSLTMAATTAAVLYVASPAIARAMGMPLAPYARLLCIPVFFEGTSAVTNARLRRRLNFSALARADAIAEVAFVLAAMVLLYLGLPRWGLAAGLASRIGTHALMIWIADPYIPQVTPSVSAARDLSGFSARVLAGRILSTLSSNADYLLVGRLMGSSALGFYSMAWDLLRFVPDRLYNIVGRVTLPTFCRLQNDQAALAEAYKSFISHISRIVIPIAACIVILAPELLAGIYGRQWIPAAMPLRVLCLGLTMSGLRLAIGSIYITRNRPIFDVCLHALRLAAIIPVVIALAGFGLFWVCVGMSLVEGGISAIGQFLACNLIGLEPLRLVAAALPGMRLALWCSIATLIGKLVASSVNLEGPFALVVIAPFPAATYLWFEMANLRESISTSFASTSTRAVVLREKA